MNKKLTAALMGVLVLACTRVNTTPLAESTGKSLSSRSVVTLAHEKPSFAAMTAGKAGFGLLGAMAMMSAGNAIVQENGIADPAIAIADQLKGVLKDKFAVQVSDAPVHQNGDDLAQICTANPDADLILDVRTLNWSFAYFPTTWNRYRVIYSASIRLIDAKNRTVIAEGFSSRVPKETPDAPTKDELLANHAQLLKEELNKGAQQCVQEFMTKALNIQPAPAQDATPALTAAPVPAGSAAAGAASVPASPVEVKPAA
jgi:hypothetical protein